MLAGGALAHYRAQPGSFYVFDLTAWLPSNLLRTWHLPSTIFWVVTAFVGGGLFLADALGSGEPRGQVRGINLLWAALVLVVGDSMVGSLIGIRQLAGKLWFWFGNQGWEYLELASGRTPGTGHRCMAEHAVSPLGSLWDERHEGAR